MHFFLHSWEISLNDTTLRIANHAKKQYVSTSTVGADLLVEFFQDLQTILADNDESMDETLDTGATLEEIMLRNNVCEKVLEELRELVGVKPGEHLGDAIKKLKEMAYPRTNQPEES